MANESNCLTQDVLIRLLQDSLSKEEQLSAAEHVQTCQNCQKELETICEQRKIELPESTSVESDKSQGSVAEWSGKLAEKLMAELQQHGPAAPHPQSPDPPLLATIIAEEAPGATLETRHRGVVDSETSVTQQYSSRSDSRTELRISEMFGRYKVEKILGQGAMGAVYLARDTQLDRDVALKIPKFGSGNNVNDQELLGRFYREARAAATLRSPYICPVHDVGEIDGQHYITMAYIEGRPLKDFTKSQKKHSEKQIATTVRKLAQGLSEAHEIGVVHRDLKPANVMVDKKGEPVVMDFGLARRSSSDDVQVTQSGAIMGTPAYMSPEQVEGDQEKIGPQADIYALGVIMYELITGEMPFKGSLMSILQQIALNNPEKPSKLRSDLDPRLEEICLKMMAGDLSKRYHTMEEVAADLQEVLRTPRKKAKQRESSNTKQKQTSIPSATEESNPALISIEPQSITEQLREKRGGAASRSKRKTSSGSSSSGVNKNLLIAGGVIGLMLLMGIVFLVRVGKYDVQITLDDPSITLSVDDNKLNINDGKNVIQLSAGPHKLQLEKDGLQTQVEEFSVTKDGKTALTATIVNGKLDALLGSESIPAMNDRSVVKNPPSGSKQQTVAKPADYDKLATGTWQSLSDSKEIVVDNNNPGSQYGAGFEWFPETVGRDVLVRAKVKMTSAAGVGIHVRTVPNEPREFSYVGDFNREQTSSGIAVINPDFHSLGNKQYFNEAVYDQHFFEIAVAAVGDRLSVYIDGKQMVEVADQKLQAEGYIGLTAFAGSAIFKDVEVMHLDKFSELTPNGNYSLQFTNPSSRVDFDFDIDLDEDFTVELWVSMTEPPTSEVPYPRIWSISRHAAITLAQPPEAEHPYFQVGCNFDPNFWITHSTHPHAAPLKKPVHLAVVKQNSKHYFFFNGRRTSHTFRNDRTKEYQKLTAMAPRKMTLGDLSAITGSVTGSSFTGLIHSMRLSRGRRYSNSANFTPPAQLKNDQDTLALYEIEEGSGTTLKDSSGNGHHGKIVGAKWVTVSDLAANVPVLPPTGRAITADDGSVELLSLIKYADDAGPSADGDPGKLEIRDDGVFFSRGALARVPVVVDSDKYEIECEFTLQNDFQLLLPVGEMLQMLDIQRDHSLLHIKDAPLTEHTNIAGKRTKIRVLVDLSQTPSQFTVDLNGQKIIQFEAAVTSMKDIRDSWVKDRWNIDKLKAAGSVAIIPNGATVHSFKLKLHEGDAKLLRSGNTGKLGAGLNDTTGPSSANAPPPAVAPFDQKQAKAHQQAWARHLGVPVEYVNSLGMKFVLIPPGEFLRGTPPEEIEARLQEIESTSNGQWRYDAFSEGPQHKAILSKPFYLGVTEVTQSQYQQVVGINPALFSATGENRDAVSNMDTSNFPVEGVDWYDAAEFCARLSEKEHLNPVYSRSGWTIKPLSGNGYRLPTEAEWEFACRGGTTTRFWPGDDVKDIIQAGWFGSNSGGRTHAVGELRANQFGLYDVIGNVWEWVEDEWTETSYKQFADKTAVDPVNPGFSRPTPLMRGIRGGYWGFSEENGRSSKRTATNGSRKNGLIGLRVALDVDAVKESLENKTTRTNTGQPSERSTTTPPPAVAPLAEAQAKARASSKGATAGAGASDD